MSGTDAGWPASIADVVAGSTWWAYLSWAWRHVRVDAVGRQRVRVRYYLDGAGPTPTAGLPGRERSQAIGFGFLRREAPRPGASVRRARRVSPMAPPPARPLQTSERESCSEAPRPKSGPAPGEAPAPAPVSLAPCVCRYCDREFVFGEGFTPARDVCYHCGPYHGRQEALRLGREANGRS